MPNVLYVCPYVSTNTYHCLKALSELEDVKLGVITHEPRERMPREVHIDGHFQVSNSLDPDQLVTAGQFFQKQWGRVDRLVGFMEQMQLPNAVARERLGIGGMSLDVTKNFREKNRMKEVLRQAGLPVARQRKITGADDARAFIGEVGYPIVLKPLGGVGSKATMRVATEDDPYAALNQLLPSPANPVQAEEFVVGNEYTFETVTIDGKHVWSSSSYYLPRPLEVLEQPWLQYCVLLPRMRLEKHGQAFLPQNTAALEALGMKTGLSHMEWFIRPDGSPVISEVGARPPGVNLMPMMSLAHDTDMWAKWCRLMVHDTFDIGVRKYAVGVAFFRAQGRGRVVREVLGIEEAQERVGQWVVDARLPKAGQLRSSHYEGEGFAIVRHPETRVVIDALRTLVTTVRVVA